jgi:hypothetical protein
MTTSWFRRMSLVQASPRDRAWMAALPFLIGLAIGRWMAPVWPWWRAALHGVLCLAVNVAFDALITWLVWRQRGQQ